MKTYVFFLIWNIVGIILSCHIYIHVWELLVYYMNTTFIFYFVNELLESRSRFNVLKALIPLFSLNLLLFIISIALARLYFRTKKRREKRMSDERAAEIIPSFYL